MKKLTLSLLWIFCATVVSAQVYKLDPVFTDRNTLTYLSYWKLLDGKTGKEKTDTFSLWGYQLYHDDWSSGAYEVEYYKGNAAEMYQLLAAIVAFSGKYGNEDKVLTRIAGVQVKTLNQMKFRYTLVFDRENKVVCRFTQKQWKHILEAFETYCQTNRIRYDSGGSL
ncbi:hypothetical protein [Niabella drilacis]|uniref:Uncharacterized protein n=1 Tax=Niabella drilacis (strain DSM 25811 / CCM 8410 / CCUG 62505 / LMG 26954 / E90) TaxID=1285928 RepID=A0A1G6KZE0_NIADE|nr:hypothetical protein [Niabella drilacis]SDC36297.1 hypothetical protein SAMN04487894_102159 [Niabella drilacis]